MTMRVLVTGWFSFEQMGATAGDLMARDIVCRWLDGAGCPYDVALAPPFAGGVDWRRVEPQAYSHVVFVCGPFGNGPPLTEFLPRFERCRLIGVDLSMLQSLDEWNPFDLLLERDSSRTARPDLVFLCDQPRVPVVGLILVHPQKEYGARALHESANNALRRLLDGREVAVVPIDTRLDQANAGGLRTPREIESLIARTDAVVTTRLHGTVLALKNGIPALAVDPVVGGAKILRQAQTIGWSCVFTADRLDDGPLRAAFDYCLSEQGRQDAARCQARARELLRGIRGEFLQGLSAATD